MFAVTEEFPTLLHFAAKYGLNELCAMLLDCPGVESACQIKNKNGLTPADLAAMENHGCLASMLDKFMVPEYYLCRLYRCLSA